jgi:hypothetical protein
MYTIKCLSLISFLVAIYSGSLQAQETLEQRMTVASKLAEFELARVFGDDVIRELSQNLPPSTRGDFVTFLSKPEHKEAIARSLAAVAAQTFSLAELQALLEFNSSSVGQSINRKQAVYTRQTMEAMNREIRPVFDQFMKGRR